MQINEISMKSYNFEKMKHFYTNILQMELIVEEENIFSVMAGTTRLNFERDFQQPYYHLCLRTNESYFDKMYEILKGMNILLENKAGETSLFWKGKQMYFTDPDGNVLEVLERDYHYEGCSAIWLV